MQYRSALVYLLIQTISQVLTDVEVERIRPKGFRISISYDSNKSVSQVAFNVNINKPLSLYETADFSALITESIDGLWVFDNINSRVEAGDKLHYWINAQKKRSHGNGHFAIPELRSVGVAVLATETINISVPTKKTCATYFQSLSSCELSATTVAQQRVCKGSLLFEENFDSFNWKTWTNEVRIPLQNEGFPFVSFQNRPENCNTSNGFLHITPTFLYDVPGFSESNIINGKLLLLGCTPIEDTVSECRQTAQFSQILPPIVSAKIQTKNSFSFRYGKVVVRAKLPRGDWLSPMIQLEPLESNRGCASKKFGHIKVAYSVGNEYLRDKNGIDISGNLFLSGVVLSNPNSLYKMEQYHRNKLRDAFHTYTLTWTEDSLSISIDGDGGNVMNKNLSLLGELWNNDDLAELFQKEHFLSLGVSVGGHRDFPDGCVTAPDGSQKPWQNDDPKAMFNFWKDRENWMKSWHSVKSGLHIDFIKVYAL